MIIKYRFLEGKNENNIVGSYGLAYTGLNNSSSDMPKLISLRSLKGIRLKNALENLSEEDIPNRNIWDMPEVWWSELFETEIPDDDYEWTPDKLLIDRIELMKSREDKYRKTA